MKPQSTLAVSHGARPTVAAFWHPWLLGAMMALLVARPLFPSESAAHYGDGLSMVMLWIALAIFWLLGSIGRPTFRLRFGWVDAAVLALVVWHTVAALWAVAHGTPRPALNMLWEWVGMGLCFFMARQLIVTACAARAVVAVMIALAVAASGYGLYQRAWEMPETQARYQADPDRALREAGLWFSPNSPERKLFESRLQNNEPTATFALANSLAAFLVPWFIVLAGILVGGDSRRRLAGFLGNRSRLLPRMLILLVPVATCLVLTKSRSGYVAACAGLLLVWWLWSGRKRLGWKVAAVATGVAGLVVAVAMAVEGSAVLGRATKSFGYRVQYWQSSVRMIADHPWLGCGPGNFQQVYTRYKLPEASEEVADPHNFFLEVWATAGTPAALALLVVLGCFAWTTRGEGRGTRDEGCVAGGLTHGESNDSRHVLIGGLAGFFLSLPLGMLSAAPPGVMPVLIGLPLASVAMALLWGWIRDGELPRWLPAVGVTVILIDLLTTGGIGFPGVAGTFWLLLALGLQQTAKGDACRRSWIAVVMLVEAIGLAAACYVTAYRPVLMCQAELRLAEQSPRRAIEHLEAASAADPLAVQPWQQLTAARFEVWRFAPNRAAFDRFEQADAESLRLAPNAATVWAASGDWHLQAAKQLRGEQRKAAIDRAVAAYRRAVQLYPTNALDRAKLAVACRESGDRLAFRREAETALRLDAATPHADKKLPSELRKRLADGLAKP